MYGARCRGRPARRQSARAFMDVASPHLAEAALQQNQPLFRERFEALRASCFSCHVLADVPHMNVTIPEHRSVPLR
jgi:hypothetical protein